MSRNCGKSQKEGGGVSAENQKVHNSKCRLLCDEGGDLVFQIFPKFKWLKYGLDFDNVMVIFKWDLGKIWYVYDWYTIEIVPM